MRVSGVSLAVCLFVLSSAGAMAADPFLGAWQLNLAKSKFNPGPAPAHELVVNADAGDGKIHTVVDVQNADGTARHVEIVYAYDGADYPTMGSVAGETIAVTRPTPYTLDQIIKVGGKMVAVNSLILRQDLKSFTATSIVTKPDGTQSKNVLVFERQG